MNGAYVFPRSLEADYQQWLVENYPTPRELAKMRRYRQSCTISVVVDGTHPRQDETHSSIREQVHPAHEVVSSVREATGEWVVVLQAGDLLAPHALYAIANATMEADMIYADEDHVDARGNHEHPIFKPDWCPDSFLSRTYAVRANAYRMTILQRVGAFRDAADLALRVTEATRRIHHIPDILVHARTERDHDSERRAVADALERRGEGGRIEPIANEPGLRSIRYRVRKRGRVDIIIPSRDQGATVDRCLASVFGKSTYADFLVTLVDNGTKEPRALEVLEKWANAEPKRFRWRKLDIPFNFSTLCNTAVSETSGDYILFLNNDTEVISPDWLEAMIEYAQRPSIGAVGGLLFYEDGTIQHAGVIVGLGGMAAHSHRALPGDTRGYGGQVITVNNHLAVSGSCLMTRREVFLSHGPFDVELPNDYQDVHYCLKLADAGLYNVYLPHVKLFHFESKSRGRDYFVRHAKQQRAARKLMVKRWKKFVEHDPCYSPHLTRAGEDYRIRLHGDHRSGFSYELLELERRVQLAWRTR